MCAFLKTYIYITLLAVYFGCINFSIIFFKVERYAFHLLTNFLLDLFVQLYIYSCSLICNDILVLCVFSSAGHSFTFAIFTVISWG